MLSLDQIPLEELKMAHLTLLSGDRVCWRPRVDAAPVFGGHDAVDVFIDSAFGHSAAGEQICLSWGPLHRVGVRRAESFDQSRCQWKDYSDIEAPFV